MTIKKSYVDGRYGQIHLRQTPPVKDRKPLICLHATAYSSQTFIPLMNAMASHRQIISIDAPGYGGSDAPAGVMEIGDYADAILEAVAAPHFDVLGYHTGAYVAAEAAIRRGGGIGRLVLIGIPYFQAIGFEEWRERLCLQHDLGEGLEQFSERWSYLVTDRPEALSLARAFANFRDELAAWPNGAAAHEAMFRWPSDARLPRVSNPVLILNPAGHLAGPSRAAANLMPNATVEELPDVTGAIFDAVPDLLASRINAFLDR